MNQTRLRSRDRFVDVCLISLAVRVANVVFDRIGYADCGHGVNVYGAASRPLTVECQGDGIMIIDAINGASEAQHYLQVARRCHPEGYGSRDDR